MRLMLTVLPLHETCCSPVEPESQSPFSSILNTSDLLLGKCLIWLDVYGSKLKRKYWWWFWYYRYGSNDVRGVNYIGDGGYDGNGYGTGGMDSNDGGCDCVSGSLPRSRYIIKKIFIAENFEKYNIVC